MFDQGLTSKEKVLTIVGGILLATISVLGLVRNGFTLIGVVGSSFFAVSSIIGFGSIKYRLRIKDGVVYSETGLLRFLNRKVAISAIEKVSMWYPGGFSYQIRSGKRWIPIANVCRINEFLLELRRQNPAIVFDDAVTQRLQRSKSEQE